MKIVVLGTYDTRKPRTRILLRGLRENGVELIECHFDVWGNVDDKSQIEGIRNWGVIIARLMICYPVLIWQYCRLPTHNAVIIGYFGLLDVLVLWPVVKIRRVPLVWDIFLSIHDTIVNDRKLVRRFNPLAGLVWFSEWLALRLVDLAIIDTEAHAQYVRSVFHPPPERVKRVLLGVEPEVFELEDCQTINQPDPSRPLRVLFYGQFIPLHGIETIVRAAKLTENEPIKWILIGKGQESERIHNLIKEILPRNLHLKEWVPYEELVNELKKCDVALGIFGTTGKAQRVIPNKVYQVLASARPLITAESQAIHELDPYRCGISLVAPGNADALAAAVIRYLAQDKVETHRTYLPTFARPNAIGSELLHAIREIA